MASNAATRSNPVLTAAALAVTALALSAWLVTSAFDDLFRCQYLIVEGVDAPRFMCDGADLGGETGVAGAVDSVADALGLGGNEPVVGDSLSVPGLSRLIDGPLAVIRRIGMLAGLLLIASISAGLTWLQRHLSHVVRLLRFDGEAWRQAAITGRTFLAVYVLLLLPVVVAAAAL